MNVELDSGVRVDAKEDERALTCLMCAAIHGNAEVVTSLVDRRASIQQRDRLGWTAVHFAIQSGGIKTVSLLAHLRANLTIKAYEGFGPQHMAARADDAPMVQVL